MLEHLPPKLSEELLDSMYRETICKVPLFKDLEEGAVHDICLAMKPLCVLRGEYVSTATVRHHDVMSSETDRCQ